MPFFNAPFAIHNQHAGSRAISLQSLNRNRQRIILLFKDDSGFRIHPVFQHAIGVLYVNFGMHGPRFFVQSIRITSYSPVEIAAQRRYVDLYNAS